MHLTKENLWDYFHNEVDMTTIKNIEQHLKECDQCKEKLNALIDEELFLQALDIQGPSEEFASKTTDKILLKRSKARNFWPKTFKAGIGLSMLLLIIGIVWNIEQINLHAYIPDLWRTIWYAMPIAFLVLLMKYQDKKSIPD